MDKGNKVLLAGFIVGTQSASPYRFAGILLGILHEMHGAPRRGGRNKSGRRPDGENALKLLLTCLISTPSNSRLRSGRTVYHHFSENRCKEGMVLASFF